MRLFLAMFNLGSATVLAAPIFGPPVFSGTACSSNASVSWALSPDSSSLSILFSEFVGPSRKFCSVLIPVNLQNQTQIQADSRIFDDLSDQASFNYQVDYKLDGRFLSSQSNLENGPDMGSHIYQRSFNFNCARVLELFVQSFLTSSSIDNSSFYAVDSIDLRGIESVNMPSICSRASAVFSINMLAAILAFSYAQYKLFF